MVLNFKDVSGGNGGGWFKPADQLGSAAILIEVREFQKNRETPNGPKDSALADVTIFATDADLAAGVPTSVSKGQRIEQTVLARDLEELVGSATIVVLEQVPSKRPGGYPAWVWRPAPATAKQQVIAYAQKREAEVQSAVADAPGFD